MIRTAHITFIIAACLVFGLSPAYAADNDVPAPIASASDTEAALDNGYYAAYSKNGACKEGRLVYFVDGSRFDEVAELPADEENITWGVVYDDTGGKAPRADNFFLSENQ